MVILRENIKILFTIKKKKKLQRNTRDVGLERFRLKSILVELYAVRKNKKKRNGHNYFVFISCYIFRI